jgi:RNA polymerase primary sigma factor
MAAEPKNTYYQSVAHHDLLDARAERALAREIQAREAEVWERLFCHASLAEYVVDLVEAGLEGEVRLPEIRRAANAARRTRTRKAREALEAEAGRAAKVLRAHDRDRALQEVVLTELGKAARGARPEQRILGGQLPFARRSRAFTQALARARSAERAAARARNRFVEANLRLVIFVARQFSGYGIPLADLIQEGNLGLMKAVDRFDPERGTRFSTYASWWIRHFIGRAVADKSRTVRVPVYLLEARQKIASTRARLTTDLGRPPTDREISEATGYTIDRIEAARRHGGGGEVSLDEHLGDDDEGRVREEIFRDPNADDSTPLDEVMTRADAAEVMELVEELPPRERDVVRRRFGLAGDREWTLQEIADEYEVTRERIRQIQLRALGRLRRSLEERREKIAA